MPDAGTTAFDTSQVRIKSSIWGWTPTVVTVANNKAIIDNTGNGNTFTTGTLSGNRVVIVLTGVSGSGKSSLAFDTIMVFPDRYPIQKAIAEAGLAPGPVFPSFPPDGLLQRYGSLPLLHQHFEQCGYPFGVEVYVQDIFNRLRISLELVLSAVA